MCLEFYKVFVFVEWDLFMCFLGEHENMKTKQNMLNMAGNRLQILYDNFLFSIVWFEVLLNERITMLSFSHCGIIYTVKLAPTVTYIIVTYV